MHDATLCSCLIPTYLLTYIFVVFYDYYLTSSEQYFIYIY